MVTLSVNTASAETLEVVITEVFLSLVAVEARSGVDARV